MQKKECDAEAPSPRLVVQRGRDIDEECAPHSDRLVEPERLEILDFLRASVPPW